MNSKCVRRHAIPSVAHLIVEYTVRFGFSRPVQFSAPFSVRLLVFLSVATRARCLICVRARSTGRENTTAAKISRLWPRYC